MEQVFKFIINFLNEVFFSKYSLFIICGLLIVPFISFLIEVILNIVLKKNTRGEVSKSTSIISVLLSTIFSTSNYISGSRVFLSVKEVVFYNLTLALLCYILYKTASIIGQFCTKKTASVVDFIESESKSEVLPPTNVKRIVETITCKTANKNEYSGYLNVDYLRELISQLKKSELEPKDLFEVEELEVYLLNFVTRQPTSEERQILSNHIGLLFKKLAKYNVVNE